MGLTYSLYPPSSPVSRLSREVHWNQPSLSGVTRARSHLCSSSARNAPPLLIPSHCATAWLSGRSRFHRGDKGTRVKAYRRAESILLSSRFSASAYSSAARVRSAGSAGEDSPDRGSL